MSEAYSLYQTSGGAIWATDDAFLAEYDLLLEAVTGDRTGSLNKAFAGMSIAAAGTVDLTGTLDKTFDGMTVAGEGVGLETASGALSVAFAGMVASGTGAVEVRGTAGPTFDGMVLTAHGQLSSGGALSITFAAMLADSNGAVTTPPTPTGLSIAAPDRPAEAIEWLFDLGSFHLGTRDLVLSGVSYSRGIVRGPEIDRHLDQVFYGFQEISRFTIEVANPTGALDALWTSEQRGVAVTLRRHDRRQAVTITEATGVVEQVELVPGRILVHCVNLDLSVLDTLIPRTLITTAFWGPNCPDAGKPEQKVLGTCQKVPLAYVVDDVPGGRFWYLLSVGTGYAVTAIYRDRLGDQQYQALDASEYGLGTVTGRTILAMNVRQLKAGGGFHRIYADVVGPSAERNFARAVKNTFSDTLWGLSQTVDATSFTAAEAALPAGLLCDGVLAEQKPARDWLKWLLMVRGMRPGYGPSGWTLAVDTATATAAMAVRDAPGAGERTMLKPGRRLRPTLDEQVSTYRMRYWKDLPTNTFRVMAADRTVHATVGKVKDDDEHPFLRDRVAADMVACYRAKRLQYNADRITGATVNEEGRALTEGQIVNVDSPRLLVSALEYQIAGVTKGSGEQRLELLGWHSDIYDYDALTLPTLPTSNEGVTPPAVTAFTLSSQGFDLATETGANGKGSAFFVLSVTMPNSPTVDSVRVDSRKTGTTSYGDAQPVHGAPGAVVLVRVGGKDPGLRYDFRAVALSGPNESAPATLSNLLASGDTTAPTTPTFTLDTTVLSGGILRVSSTPAADHKVYEYQIRASSSAANGTGAGTLVKSGTFDGTLPINAADIGYNLARHVRIRAKDDSGNPTLADGVGANWTATQSFTFTKAGGVDILPGGGGGVGTGNIDPGAVSSPGTPLSSDGTLNFTDTETNLGSFTLDAGAGGNAIVTAKIVVSGISGGAGSATFFAFLLRKGGMAGPVIDGTPAPVTAPGSVALFAIDTSPGSGQQYTITGQHNGSPGATVATVFRRGSAVRLRV